MKTDNSSPASAINQVVQQSLQYVAMWLGILYAVFAVSYLVSLPSPIARKMSLIPGGTAIFLLGLRIQLKSKPVPVRWAHPASASIILLSLLNSLVLMVLTQDIKQTTFLMVAVVGAGFFILSTSWFITVSIIALAGWGVTVAGFSSTSGMGHYGFGLFSALCLGFIIHFIHLNSIKKLTHARQRELARAEELKRFFSVSRDLLGVIKSNGNLTQVNEAFERTMGLSRESLLSTSYYNLIYPKDVDTTRDKIGQSIPEKGLAVFENRLLCADGSHKWILWNAIPLPDQELIYLAGRDITQRHKMEERLHQRNRELSALNGIIAPVTSSIELDIVYQTVVEAVNFMFNQAAGASLQTLEENDALVTRAKSGEYGVKVTDSTISEGAVSLAIKQRKVVNIVNVHADKHFLTGNGSPHFKSLLIVPLVTGGRVIGTISVQGDQIAAFGADDERSAQVLGSYAAVSIENARLYEEKRQVEAKLTRYTNRLQEMVEERTGELQEAQEQIFAQKRLQEEVELAHQVQQSLLSHSVPEVDGFVFAATALPARYVGGDFYDFVLEGNSCYLTLADIAGKGIPAAMLTSTARALVRAAISGQEKGPAHILMNAERAIYQDLNRAEMFITMFSAHLDTKSGIFAYANAGHTESLWCRAIDGECQRLSATGLPVGVWEENPIAETNIALIPGDLLVFYSDGITETVNAQGEFYGVERLSALLKKNRHTSAHTVAQHVLVEVEEFSGGTPLVDDLTLVVLKVKPRTLRFTHPAKLDELDAITTLIHQNVIGYGDDFAYQVQLASSEIITNIIKYAYPKTAGKIRCALALQEDSISLDFFDDGKAFNPEMLEPVNLDAPNIGGYGLFIVQQLMNEVKYSASETDGNHWHLVKNLKGSAT